MIWLVPVVIALVIVALVMRWLNNGATPPDVASYQARVELHGIQRRQEADQVKREVRRDAASARRELRDELEGRRRT